MNRNRNRYTRNATHRATVNTVQPVRTYNGDAWVYILASRVNPNLAKVGTGNPEQRRAHWAATEPGGLFIFEAYEFATRHEADAVENAFHEAYQFANRNSDPTQGSQEFYTMPPSQAKVYLDRAHTAYTAQAAAEPRAADAEAALSNAITAQAAAEQSKVALIQRADKAEWALRNAEWNAKITEFQIDFLKGAIEGNPDVTSGSTRSDSFFVELIK